MTEPQKPLPHVKPFVERKTSPPQKQTVDMRGMLSIATMLASLATVTMALGGGFKLVLDIFSDGLVNSMGDMPVKVAVLGFTFLFGWITGLISIRGFGNLFYPLIIRIYAWGCLGAVGILYIKIIQKLYVHTYDGMRFGMYLAILLGGLFALFFLHLLIEDHDLRPFAIPLLIISVIHLFVIVFHYVFAGETDGMFALADFTVFILMIVISGLMLMHIGIFSPMREAIGDLFEKKPEPEGRSNGNGVS
ncbi:hypothetical protein ANAEL_04039 [Anaerolineales bacterium]|nr:hypothetical protein ANAEL_04039 [Anaerolineales bacterium]